MDLPPGTHRLKFIVDDEWKCSNEMETATDPDGNLVNYLQVMNEDDEFADEFGDSRTEPGNIHATLERKKIRAKKKKKKRDHPTERQEEPP